MRPVTSQRIATYFKDVAVAWDQALNVTFFFGEPGETMSAHMGRAMIEGRRWGKIFSWCLNTIQKKHVQDAIVHDEERAQLVIKLEEKAKVEDPHLNSQS